MKVNEYHSTVDQVQKAYQSEGTKRLEEEGNKNRTHAKQGKMVTTKEKRQIPEKEKTIGAKYSLAADSDPVVIASESNLKVCNKKADGGERDYEIDKTCANYIHEKDDIKLDSNIENGNSDEILRYLVHNTTPDGVRFFLTAVRSRKTIAQFGRSWLCRGKCNFQRFNASTVISSI